MEGMCRLWHRMNGILLCAEMCAGETGAHAQIGEMGQGEPNQALGLVGGRSMLGLKAGTQCA